MGWVLDCSLALAWALPDETSRRADQFLVRVSRDSDIWVPALWWYEMANALAMAQRRQRLPEADSTRLVELYGMLPIHTDVYLNAEAIRFKVQSVKFKVRGARGMGVGNGWHTKVRRYRSMEGG
jgi:predicted nucleic acid-binding protein